MIFFLVLHHWPETFDNTLTQITPIVQTLSNNLYRGTLAVPGKDIPIVVKQSRIEGDVLGFVSQLKGEAMAQSCQAEVVPLFYGFYEGNIGGCPLACIHLQDCGDPCNDDLKNLDMSIKWAMHDTFLCFPSTRSPLLDSQYLGNLLLSTNEHTSFTMKPYRRIFYFTSLRIDIPSVSSAPAVVLGLITSVNGRLDSFLVNIDPRKEFRVGCCSSLRRT